MKQSVKRLLLALTLLLVCSVSFFAGRQSAPTLKITLDNARVTVTESLTPARGRREPYVRPTDQLIVFLDDANYESIDSSGTVTARSRKAGDVIWHSKGEAAPLLVNKGKAYRNLIVALK